MGIFYGIISAVLLTFSGPGFQIPFINMISFIPIFLYLGKRPEKWLFTSLSFGIFYYFINLFWITEAVNYFGDVPIIVSMILLFILSCYLGLYYVLFFYAYTKLETNFSILALFLLTEMVKSFFLSGFPWMNLGLTAVGYRPLLMNAALVGEMGVSIIIIAINLFITKAIFGKRKYIVYLILTIVLSHIYYFYKDTDLNNQNISFSMVQPSYDHKKKWDIGQKYNVANEVIKYTEEAFRGDSDIVVLPESAFPFYLQTEIELLNYFKDLSEKKPFIIGNIRFTDNGKIIKAYNSNFYVNNRGIEFYDKIHLVPFGEYFPLKFITSGIQKYFFGTDSDFTPGEKIVLFQYRGRKIGNLICYEDAFFELARRNLLEGAEIFVVTTNDSWFGKNYGRDQHFAMDIMRSVETGRGFVRSSQSGISGCIAPYGKVVSTLGVDVKGVLSCSLPLNNEKTIFSIIGYWWGILLFILAATLEFRAKKR